MRILIIILLFSFSANAQKKPQKKEPVPSQKELNEMMKELGDAMSAMSPEEKRMMDSLGLKLPSAVQVNNMAAIASAHAESSPIPKRDAARIAAIPKTVLNTASLPSYILSVEKAVKAKFPQKVITGSEELYREMKVKFPGSASVAELAIACWTSGKPGPALLFMIKAATEDPSNADHLNNLAAMLSMTGGEHISLPILTFLNRQFPRNSTILNNIAHAWFGLGEINKASQYIDSTIRLCAWHPQANQVKAVIEESKGNHDAAVKAMKQSISRMYSSEKANALDDLGHDLGPDDLQWKPPARKDEMGLSKFKWPRIPKNVQESKQLKPDWMIFLNECSQLASKLSEEGNKLGKEYQEAFQERMMHDLNAPKTGARSSALFKYVSPKAEIKLRPRIDQLLKLEADDPMMTEFARVYSELERIKTETSKEFEDFNKKWRGRIGEGIGIPPEYCSEYDGINDRLLQRANSLTESFFQKYRDRVYTRINEMTHYNLYRAFPEELAFNINLAKQEWIAILKAPGDLIVFREPNSNCGKSKELSGTGKSELGDYDEINCKYKSEINYGIGTIRTECGRIIAELEVDFVKVGWETKSADREENRNFLDEFQRCTIEITAGKSKSFGEGPLQLEVSAGVTGFLEFDRTGITDAGVKLGADVNVGTNVMDTKVSTDIGDVNVGPGERSVSVGGANAKISINSGFTASGSGVLKGVRF